MKVKDLIEILLFYQDKLDDPLVDVVDLDSVFEGTIVSIGVERREGEDFDRVHLYYAR